MTPRERVRHLAGRLLADRAVPVGRVARDRRLLRQVLTGDPGRVLVLGPGLAVRQVLPRARVDVAGTSPHVPEVTVCSTAQGPRSLPTARWDVVVVPELGPDPQARVQAATAACRPGGRVLLLDREGWPPDNPVPAALARDADVRTVVLGRTDRLWVAERRP